MNKTENKGWAADCAADFLRRRGYLICDSDTPDGLPLVAWDVETETMCFFRLRHADALKPLRTVPSKARQTFAEAVRKWCRVNKWRQGKRLDEVRVYGRPDDGRPCIDHIQNIKN